ncbi:6-phospho-3-hexuloisomerase [Bacillaceae bacterium SIJ1]|uniref:6-phospho-3-hexuloisomerase n=1 Tax=Litoribacterium kuwaitense TaxID=1398745 RepID=UPI0013EB6E25|nr:6-phospho-3-hexuloisomerase [Litoribacterium kuwaitense]NGP44834.1 6-phospho-3-hexuloisomerase [Litoribacterium kuwaitense]
MKETMKTVANEVLTVVERVSEHEAEAVAHALLESNRIFVSGEGRSGLVGKTFAMRLMHGGFPVFVIGETITPSVAEGDLFLAISGSGSTGSIVSQAEKAKRAGSRVVAVTTNGTSPLAQLAEHVLEIPAATKYRRKEEPPTIQPLGNQFDQSLHLVLDAIIIYALEKSKMDHETMTKRHANTE